jgi:hypothetical protein
LRNRSIDVRTEWCKGGEIGNDGRNVAVGINHSRLGDILTGDGLIAASQNVVVAEDVIRPDVINDERSKSAATAEAATAVVDVTSGHTEFQVANSVIGAIICKTRRQRTSNDNCEDS